MIRILIAGVALLVGKGPVNAHHSFTAAYDNTKRVKVEGVVKEFVWRNPHSFIRIDVTNKDGGVDTWNLEWGIEQPVVGVQVRRDANVHQVR